MGRRKYKRAKSSKEQASTSQFPHQGFLIVLLLFIIFATLYSIMVPITQGEDELAHFRYISFIAESGRLPINFEEREQAWYRSDWPPLYHLLVGWTVSPLNTSQPHLKDVGEFAHRRLVGKIFYPRLIIYTEDASWPWQDGILAWHIGRFISILFSAAALVFVYFTVLELLWRPDENKEKPDFLILGFSPITLAVLTTALLAFTPRYLFTSSMLGDDSLFILLSAIFIWLLLRALRGHDQWWVYILLGLIAGSSIVTKYSTGLFPLILIPVVWWRTRQAQWSWVQSVSRVAVNWVATIVGASWWFGWIGYYFNTIRQDGLMLGLLSPLLNSGPDVAMRRIFSFLSCILPFLGECVEFTGQERPDGIEEGTFREWLVYLFQSFWGVPVLEYDPLFPWAYILMALLCIGAIVGLWQLWQSTDGQGRMNLTILFLVLALLIPFPVLRFFLTKNVLETGQGRHILYPAAQSIPILLVFGWATLLYTFTNRRFASENDSSNRTTNYHNLIAAPVLLLGIWSIFQYAYMTRIYPDPLPVQTTTFNQANIPVPITPQQFGEAIELIGYNFQPDAEQALINLTLFWEISERVEENYRVQVNLRGTDGQTHFTWLSHPLNGRYPTRAWDEGDVIRDHLPLPLAGIPADTYSLELDLLQEAENVSIRGEPYQFIQIPLGERQPIAQAQTLGEVDYRLWIDEADTPVRYRQTLPISWIAKNRIDQGITWSVIGPDDIPRSASVAHDNNAIFVVGADWPSGDYHLQLEQGDEINQTEPLFTVANDIRTFDFIPPDPPYTQVDANFADQVKLLGYSLPTHRTEPGGGLPLTLYWQSLDPVLGDYVIFDKLLNENQVAFGGYDRLPREFYSTILWADGEVVDDGFSVPVSPGAPPGVYQLHIGLYSLETGEPVSLPLMHEGQPTETTSVVVGPIKVGGPPPDVVITDPKPQFPRNQPFGGVITLLGYDLVINETTMDITLYWRSDAQISTDYTTFLHLRDKANQNVAQQDNPPAQGRYPTSLWDPGEIIIDKLILPIDGQLPVDIYTPVIGLYNLDIGRLPTEGIPENELRLESVPLQ